MISLLRRRPIPWQAGGALTPIQVEIVEQLVEAIRKPDGNLFGAMAEFVAQFDEPADGKHDENGHATIEKAPLSEEEIRTLVLQEGFRGVGPIERLVRDIEDQRGNLTDTILDLVSLSQARAGDGHEQADPRGPERSVLLENEIRGIVFREALHGVGVLNYADSTASGERRFLERFLQNYPAATILDVGANDGQYAGLIKDLSPDTTIHSFEPNPVSFAELARRAEVENFYAHNIALGNLDGEVTLFDYADEQGSQHASLFKDVIEIGHQRKSISTTVKSARLDTVIQKIGLDSVGLLKIDTEGNEYNVLQGAERSLSECKIDVIHFEFNEMNVHSSTFFRDFFNLLSDYNLYRLLPNGVIVFQVYDCAFMEIFAYQNIVAIRRGLEQGWIR